jgi:hypothetical protein
MLLAIVKTSHCVQLHVTESQDHNACRNVFERVLRCLKTGEDSGTMFAHGQSALSLQTGNIV